MGCLLGLQVRFGFRSRAQRSERAQMQGVGVRLFMWLCRAGIGRGAKARDVTSLGPPIRQRSPALASVDWHIRGPAVDSSRQRTRAHAQAVPGRRPTPACHVVTRGSWPLSLLDFSSMSVPAQRLSRRGVASGAKAWAKLVLLSLKLSCHIPGDPTMPSIDGCHPAPEETDRIV